VKRPIVFGDFKYVINFDHPVVSHAKSNVCSFCGGRRDWPWSMLNSWTLGWFWHVNFQLMPI